MKKLRKLILRICVVTVVLVLAYPLLVFGRFKAIEHNTEVAHVDNSRDRLTIFYRNNCKRCKGILPQLLLKHGFEFKHFNVVNADKLSKQDIDKYDIEITPVFRINKHSYNTVDMEQIDKIWTKSK